MRPITWHWRNWKKPGCENRPPEQAEDQFRNTLELLPEPGPSQPYYHMLRWGANANLGPDLRGEEDGARAIAYEIQRDPTTQGHGNLLRARELVWRSPMAAAKVTLPSAPAPRSITAAPAALPRFGPGQTREIEKPRHGRDKTAMDRRADLLT